MKVIVRRCRTRHIDIQLEGDTALVNAPFKASVHDIKNALINYNSYVCATNQHHRVVGKNIKGNQNRSTSRINMLFDDATFNNLVECKSLLLGGHIYGVEAHNIAKSQFSGDKLYLPTDKFCNSTSRCKAVKAFVKQYSNINLRASISKHGCELSYCPSNIKLTTLPNNMWYDNNRMMANNAIILDYRVVQLPYTCQDRLIDNCYQLLLGNNVASEDYIDNMCQQYYIIKQT